MDVNMDEGKFEPIMKLETCENNVESIEMESFDTNPWLVEDVTVFLKYCCPECEYNSEDSNVFSIHALQNHERSTSLFQDNYNINQMLPKTEIDAFDSDINDNKDNEVLKTLKNNFTKAQKKCSEKPKAKKTRFSKSAKKCSVPFCPTVNTSGFHNFPKDPVKREAWKKLCGLKQIKPRSLVCNSHFKPSDFGTDSLGMKYESI